MAGILSERIHIVMINLHSISDSKNWGPTFFHPSAACWTWWWSDWNSSWTRIITMTCVFALQLPLFPTRGEVFFPKDDYFTKRLLNKYFSLVFSDCDCVRRYQQGWFFNLDLDDITTCIVFKVCVGMCVCMREREREGITIYILSVWSITEQSTWWWQNEYLGNCQVLSQKGAKKPYI